MEIADFKIYIAGPMRGKPFYNFPAFDEARDAIKAIGFTPLSPADIDRQVHHFDGRACDPSDPCLGLPTYRDCITGDPREFNLHLCVLGDMEVIVHADAILLLPGWAASAGARAELAVAEWLGLPVFESMKEVEEKKGTLCKSTTP